MIIVTGVSSVGVYRGLTPIDFFDLCLCTKILPKLCSYTHKS